MLYAKKKAVFRYTPITLPKKQIRICPRPMSEKTLKNLIELGIIKEEERK